jgi:hypothetical protein
MHDALTVAQRMIAGFDSIMDRTIHKSLAWHGSFVWQSRFPPYQAGRFDGAVYLCAHCIRSRPVPHRKPRQIGMSTLDVDWAMILDILHVWLLVREDEDDGIDVGDCLLALRRATRCNPIRRVTRLWCHHTPLDMALRDVVRARKDFRHVQDLLRHIPESVASGSYVLHLYLRMMGRRPSWEPNDLDIFVCVDRVTDWHRWSWSVNSAFGTPTHTAPYTRTVYSLFHRVDVTPSQIPDDDWTVEESTVPSVVRSQYHDAGSMLLNITLMQTDSLAQIFRAFDMVHNAVAIDKNCTDFILADNVRRCIYEQEIEFAEGAFSFRGSVGASVSHQRDRIEKYIRGGFLPHDANNKPAASHMSQYTASYAGGCETTRRL